MALAHLDFETRSCADLRRVGLDSYLADPTTEVLCAGIAFDDEPVDLWVPGMAPPARFLDHLRAGGEVWAHNAFFEIGVINDVCVRRYGWPSVGPESFVCTMVMAYAMGLPGALENVAPVLGVKEVKDMAGNRLMIQCSKPKAVLEDGTVTWWDDSERLNKVYDYCRQDVVVEREIGKRMLRLSAYEKKVWELDWRINKRGIRVDVQAVTKAIEMVEIEKERLNAEMKLVSDNAVATCTAVQQIKDYLGLYGIPAESLDKASLGEHLSHDLPAPVRRVLELRAEAGKAATSKFAPMVESAGSDQRVRGCFQYSGANTRRWAGRRIQLHNLKRPKLKFETIENIIADISAGRSPEELAMYYGSPMNILGDCVRSFLVAAPGGEFNVADFSAIEARVLAWLAGEESVLEVFRDKQDPYKVEASNIFGVSRELVTDDQRQVGKVAILALGYGGGVGAFSTMARGYGVKMEPAFETLYRRANPEQRIRARKTFESQRDRFPETSEKEFLASDLTKIFWREANPNIVMYWANVEKAAISAVENPGKVYQAARFPSLVYKKVGSFLWCQLPGGGVLCYPYPEIKKTKTSWGAEKFALTYMAEDGQTRKWQRYSTYGGSLVENITQAVSRDILADSMLRLDSAGFSIVAHVHDEVICEEVAGSNRLNEMTTIMTTNPPWATGLPLAAKGFTSSRYKKE